MCSHLPVPNPIIRYIVCANADFIWSVHFKIIDLFVVSRASVCHWTCNWNLMICSEFLFCVYAFLPKAIIFEYDVNGNAIYVSIYSICRLVTHTYTHIRLSISPCVTYTKRNDDVCSLLLLFLLRNKNWNFSGYFIADFHLKSPQYLCFSFSIWMN